MKNLKTVFATVTALLLLNSNSFSQKVQQESGKCVEEGTIIIDGYYGFPYVMGALLADANSYSSTTDKIVNYNHMGGKVEYMISNMVSMGVDYTYAKVVNNYSDSYYTTVNGQSVLQYGNFTESLIKQRFLVKVNIHFATSNSLDPYATAGLGYKYTAFNTNNPNNVNYDLSFFNAFPIAFRMGAGLRWFFTENVGISVEAGIGGPLLQGGLSLKF